MDIARPELKRQKQRRRIILLVTTILVVAAIGAGGARLKPAAPSVGRGNIWTDTVKRGPLLRQVRGLGTLTPTPEAVLQIPAETAATVVRIHLLPGSPVKADTVLVEMSDPQVEQATLDAQLQLKAAEAELESLRVKLESDLINEEASAEAIKADYRVAKRQADTDKALFEAGVTSALTSSASSDRAEELAVRNDLEKKRLGINRKAIDSQIAAQEAKVDQMRTLAQLKKAQFDLLRVRAGIDGVLVDLPLQVGQHVLPGTMLAKVVEPNHLMAVLKVPETQARDVQIGQAVSIDTHNGVIVGAVIRVDPAVQNGTVTVDAKLTGDLPTGARPDLSVDGTIDLERLDNVLYVGRPAFGQENNTISLFKLDPGGSRATRIHVTVGRASVNAIQVIDGLQEGDAVILSDMSRWENTDHIKLE